MDGAVRACSLSGLRVLLVLVAITAAACLPRLPGPPLGPQEQADPVLVPYPFPPARVDVVSDPPAELKSPVWVDGQWLWRGRRWVWESGDWVELKPGDVYAKPIVVRRSDGQLVWFAGTFRRDTPAVPAPTSSTSQ